MLTTLLCDAESVESGQKPENLVVHHARSGCSNCKDRLIEQNASRLRSFVDRITFGSHDREDIFQQTICRAIENLKQFRGDSNFLTWLCTIALNEMRQSLRKQKRRVVISLEPHAIDSWAPDRPTESSFDLCCRAELKRNVRKAVMGLPARYRSVVELRDLNQLSLIETAEALQLSPSAVKSRLFRARKLLARVSDLRPPEGHTIGVSALDH